MDNNVGLLVFKSMFSGLIQALPSLWPILIMILLMGLVTMISYLIRQHRYRKAGMNEIDKMSGEEFEQYLVSLFSKLGYQAEHIGKLGDYGGDLILTKDGVRTLVQAKRQNSRVKEGAVQQAIAAKDYYRCDRAMVVTNNYFYWHAWNLGKKTETILWTRKELIEAILKNKSLGN